MADRKHVAVSVCRDSSCFCPTEWCALATPLERVTIGRVQCLAMTPVRSVVQGKGEWPSPLAVVSALVRACRHATRFTFSSRRRCGSPSPEGGTITLFSRNYHRPSTSCRALPWVSMAIGGAFRGCTWVKQGGLVWWRTVWWTGSRGGAD